jgi:hypothetical protein
MKLLYDQYAVKENECAQLRLMQQTHEESVHKLNKDVAQWQKLFEDAFLELEQRTLKQQYEEEVDELSSQNTTKANEINRLNGHLLNLKEEFEGMSMILRQKEQELTDQLENSSNQIIGLQNQMKLLYDQYAVKENECAQLRLMQQTHEESVHKLNKDVAQWQKLFEDANEQKEKITDSFKLNLEAHMIAKVELGVLNESLENDINNSSQKLNKQRQLIDQANASLLALQTEFNSAKQVQKISE